MPILKSTGIIIFKRIRQLNFYIALSFSVFILSLNPFNWKRTVRNVLARQILFTGIDAFRFLSIVAFIVGIIVVVQLKLWLDQAGQSELLGHILVSVVIRELAPLITTLIIIARSGTAIATELATMRVEDETTVLEAQGIDPVKYLVMPRMIGIAVSVFSLTIFFIFIAIIGGYLSGQLIYDEMGIPSLFIKSILQAITSDDIYNLLIKTTCIPFLIGAICCTQGLQIEGAITEVPQATSKACESSIELLFICSALVSIITYMR